MYKRHSLGGHRAEDYISKCKQGFGGGSEALQVKNNFIPSIFFLNRQVLSN